MSLPTEWETISTYTLTGNLFKVDHYTILLFIILLMGEEDSIKVLLQD